MKPGILGILCIALLSLSWSIGTEGRSPNERPDWWKEYQNAPC